jgi:N4-gp56 family major capsid protein
MANNTQTTLANAIKTQYERRLLTRALPRLVHGRWGMTARLNKVGAYELRKYGALSAVTAALTEGTTPSEQAAISLTLVTITPSFYGAWLGYTDELEMTVFDPIISEFSSILGEQAGLSADTLIRNTITDGATADYAGDASSRVTVGSNDSITYAGFVAQLAALEAANALPVDGDDYIVILHPNSWAKLMQDATFVAMFQQEASRESNSPIRSGYVGRLLRAKIFVSSNARVYAGEGETSGDVYSMLFIAREAYGYVGMAGSFPQIVDNLPNEVPAALTGKEVKPVEIILKQLGSAGADDPLNQRATIGWKMSLGVAMTNSSWARNFEHYATL